MSYQKADAKAVNDDVDEDTETFMLPHTLSSADTTFNEAVEYTNITIIDDDTGQHHVAEGWSNGNTNFSPRPAPEPDLTTFQSAHAPKRSTKLRKSSIMLADPNVLDDCTVTVDQQQQQQAAVEEQDVVVQQVGQDPVPGIGKPAVSATASVVVSHRQPDVSRPLNHRAIVLRQLQHMAAHIDLFASHDALTAEERTLVAKAAAGLAQVSSGQTDVVVGGHKAPGDSATYSPQNKTPAETALVDGDVVRILKEGTQTGKLAIVKELNWAQSGRIKVEMVDEEKSIKTYLLSEVRKLSKARKSSLLNGNHLILMALKKWGVYARTQAFTCWKRLLVPSFEVEAWQRMYSIIDADRDGTIDSGELAVLVRQFGMLTTEDGIMEVFNKYDTDGDGGLDEHEFLNMMTTMHFKDLATKKISPQEIHTAKWSCQFNLLDDRGSGTLSLNKIRKLFSTCGYDFNPKQLASVYTHFGFEDNQARRRMSRRTSTYFKASADRKGVALDQFTYAMKVLKNDKQLLESILSVKMTFFDQYREGAYIIAPDSHLLLYWNIGTVFWVLYSALVVPSRLAFNSKPSSLTLLLDYLSEIWFMADIVVSFNSAYTDLYSGELVINMREIRRKYLKGWFVVDVLSSVPTTFITLVYEGFSNFVFLRVLRMLKMFRLVKLMRLTTLQELEQSGKINPSITRLTKIIFSFALLLHFVACMYWTVAEQSCTLLDDLENAPFHTETFCPEPWRMGAYDNMSWAKGDQPTTDIFEKYWPSLYWALMVLVGGGASEPRTNKQYQLACAMLLVGIAAFSSILGSLTTMLQSFDSMNAAKSEQLSSINAYLAFRKVDHELCVKIRGYYNYLWSSGQSSQQRSLFEELPDRLNLELRVALKEDLLLSVDLFRGLQPRTLLAIMDVLESKLLMPNTTIVKQGDFGSQMYLLNRGRCGVFVGTDVFDETPGLPSRATAEKLVATLKQGACFGELAMFGDCKRNATIKSLAYSEIEILAYLQVKQLSEEFPDLQVKLQNYAKNSFAVQYFSRKAAKAKECAAKTGTVLSLAQRQRTGLFKASAPKTNSAQVFPGSEIVDGQEIFSKCASWSSDSPGLSKKQNKRLKKRYDAHDLALVSSLYVAARDTSETVDMVNLPRNRSPKET